MKNIILSISLLLFIFFGVAPQTFATPFFSETLKENKNAASFTVYPNPVKDKATVTITLSSNEQVRLELVDITGKIVQEIDDRNRAAGEHKIQLRTTELKNGVYFCKVTAGSKSFTKRIIIQH